MVVKWSASAQRDLARHRAFVAASDRRAAERVVLDLLSGALQLASYPQLGAQLEEFTPRDVRRLIIGDYELRYELRDAGADVVRVWHVREDR